MARSVKGFLVEIGADVKDFVRGTQEADRELADLATDAATDLGKIETAAKEAADGMERAFDKAASDSRASFKKISDNAGRDLASGDTKQTFGEAGSEVGAEFAQNLGESMASNDLASIAKDTAGGLVSAFQGLGGPIGLGLAGIATAATGIFATIQKEAEAKAARIAAVTGAIFDELSEGMQDSLSEMTRGEAYQEFVKGFSKEGTLSAGLRQMESLAKRAGVNVGDIATAFIQGGPAAETLKQRLIRIRQEGTTTSTNSRVVAQKISDSAKAAKDLQKYMGEADKSTADAEASSRALLEQVLALAQAAANYENNMKLALEKQQRAASAAKRGAPGTVVGGRALN